MSWIRKDKTGETAELQDLKGQMAAIGRSQAVIEFTLDGKILTANQNFLSTVGYTLDEIRGQHHGMFVDPAYRQSAEYRQFWDKLGRGEFEAGQYRRVGKGGKEIWLQASYNAILDLDGKPFKVVKYATDITEQKLRTANFEGQLAAIGKSQAVIEFTLDGIILTANENFEKTMGYSLAEVRGQHHGMFVEPSYRQSPEYRVFWEKLARGEFDAGQYKRIARGGREVYLQASYNPILDASGKPYKVVKFATDVTMMVQAVHQIQSAVAATKDNDLTVRVPLDGKSGDIMRLCEGVNSVLDTMMSVIAEVKTSAREVASASAEISTSTTDLSQRTEEQAASLEETSASMEQIAVTVKKNADNAQLANKSAASTREVADRGGQVVAKAVEAMSQIEGSSRKISDIIGVIDEIARQTNLLALNAAVEAARAGEAGRGFAVVASEVRSLAQRSSQAAKDIKDLITNSNNQVQTGVELVNKAGAALADILESIKQVAGVVSDIAGASMEQSTGIEQVNKALSQMDEVTQQNSALVEENAATAKTLENQSKTMTDLVEVFRIADSAGMAGASPPAASPKQPSQTARPRPAAAAKPREAARKIAKGSARSMQTALAVAVNAESDWKEF